MKRDHRAVVRAVLTTALTMSLTVVSLAGEKEAPRERSIVADVVVNAPRSEVWKTFTTTEGVTTFFASNAWVELRRGGPFEIYFDARAPRGSRGSEGCVILSYVPQEMLSFTWNAPTTFIEVRGQRTFVVVQLSDAGEGKTRVHLTNGGYPPDKPWDEVFAYFQRAWPHVLANLEKRFDSGPLWANEQRMTVKPVATAYYAYVISPVRDVLPETQTPEEIHIIEAHVAYLKGLLAQNHLIMAGRSLDSIHYPRGADDAQKLDIPLVGIVVFAAEHEEQARQMMENDPAVKQGLFKARVSPFSLVFMQP